MTEKKLPNGIKLVFAPGSFDNFEGTQEELDSMIKEIEEGFADGSFFEKSQPIDITDGTWSEDEIERLEQFLDQVENGSNRTTH